MAAPVAHAPTGRSGENPGSAAARFAGHGSAGASRPVYRRHEAEKTVLYQIVSRELETFLTEVRDHYDHPLPAYVEKELRDFLDCGILARGFVTAVCERCGQKLLVALSCKKRGICPSCGCRRMCNAAAHLAEHVVPDIPVRQWVMSAPFGIRFLLASRADAFTALTNIFVHQVFRWQREQGRALGMAEVQSGALVTQHRFGSSLNLHTHLHAVLPDGVFLRPDPAGRAQFDVLPAPTPDDLVDIAFNVHQCFRRWCENQIDDVFGASS